MQRRTLRALHHEHAAHVEANSLQNWMTDKSLAGPEWENPRHRDEHSNEVSRAFAAFIGQFGADEFANQAQAPPSRCGAA